jgi:nucleoside-triphosphatase
MNNNKVVIITGEKGEGKTTKLLIVIDLLKKYEVPVVGFTAVGEWNNGERSKYTMVDIITGKSAIICVDKVTKGYEKHGRFYFNPRAVEFGENILYKLQSKKSVVVIDEIGPFELDGEVWHNSLVHHLENTHNLLLLSVRKKLVAEIVEKFNLANVSIYNTQASTDDIVKEIIQNVI